MVGGKALKRVIDLTGAAVLFVVLAPIMLAAALAVLLFEGWPVFYISRRFVRRDREVAIVKLRTMVRDARSPRYDLQQRFMKDGYLDVPLSCEVYTPIGRILERTQLVEVPQLLNVLSGSMSLIGNRPLPGYNLQLLSRFDGWERRFDSPAGITGIAQIVGKHYLQPPDRVQLESAYAAAYQRGDAVKVDLRIAYHTIRLLLTGRFLDLEAAYALVGSSVPARRATDSAQVVAEDVPPAVAAVPPVPVKQRHEGALAARPAQPSARRVG